jgi:hypothetical protein
LVLLCAGGWRGEAAVRKATAHRQLLDAVRYVVDNGVKWANLPADFP